MQRSDEKDLTLRWSNRLTLRQRIMAVNVFALAILAGSLFYLDSFRSRLTEARLSQARVEAALTAEVVAASDPAVLPGLIARMGQHSGTRLRLYGVDGRKRLDSWTGAPRTYELRDPKNQSWTKDVAQALDNVFDWIVGAPRLEFYDPKRPDDLRAWPEARATLATTGTATFLRRAPEGTPFISAAARVPGRDGVLLLTINARDIRTVMRDERATLAIVLFTAILLSILLSRFLARTIADPLRRLASAAHAVRLGRSREVHVPLLPARRDEIGLLARVLNDMTQSLRDRIDATEAFAADVTHELKNPLASLRSAVDSLDRVGHPELRRQLLDVVRQDVVRLDRLVMDIAEASRLDAELSRARFEPVDLGAMIETLLAVWEPRAAATRVGIAFARPRAGSAVIMGEESRLARLFDNVVDNAISFSPEGGLVEVVAAFVGKNVLVSIEDEGPGVPVEARGTIFNRFQSIRPETEDFGRHSGLGLAIAKAIAEGHDGRIEVSDRHDGRPGARFSICFPAAAA